MGRMYTASFKDQAATAADTDIDLFEILPASGKPIVLHAVSVSQSTEVGDAEEEMLTISVVRGHTTSGSGGTSTNGNPVDPDDGVDAATIETMNDAVATAGTAVELHSHSMNVRVGWEYIWTPETRIKCKNAELLVVRMQTTLADNLSFTGTIYYEEL